ncbi:hypothetical protein [Octadecabacter ascidiaceicola]|uniref:Uncharacterized protein n=1 Tax=Octadecabacter ascidiaceicola TaxID=1655543 RepID=A0A238KBI3_9RHOB|nr:hypothetical protein [Octadecabacter ascidiaceicola]SMX39386.1 hypothetical protein OCA8868_01953 [Octadecabacter ascidiaceicola]
MTKEISLEQWLIGQGLTPQEADLWCDFISESFDLIDDGYALLCKPNEWNSFLNGCHTQSPTEPEITSGLGDRMKRLQADAPMESSRDRLQVAYEVATLGDESHGIRKPKADFEIRRKFEAGYSAAYVIEAKPLRTPADMNSRYLGDEGIGCFLEREPPYSKDKVVGMMGYSFKNHSSWEPLLTEKITAIGATKGLVQITLPSGRKCKVSEHERTAIGLPMATVTHTILDYTQSI